MIVVKSQLGEEFDLPSDTEMPPVQASSLQGCANMVKLEELSEGALLHNLRMRYEKDQIYTYISSILISVNPFKMLPIYSPKVMNDFQIKLAKGEDEKLPPHVFAVADHTFRSLNATQRDQSVIISGESGAGKTEATKLVLQYLAEMSGQSSVVEQQLLQANPILEAFGNAKTVRNNNSSRFGKWIEITFNTAFHIAGAKIVSYLLEKSRLVRQGPGERNYHIFYNLCKGASPQEHKQFKLAPPSRFRYLNQGGEVDVEGRQDAKDFMAAKQAMRVLNFSEQEQHLFLRVVAAVLHLGNLSFGAKSGGEVSFVESRDELKTVCALLGCREEDLERALVTRKYKGVGEVIEIPLDANRAADGRDALAKALYGNLFLRLIRRLNTTLFKEVKRHYVVGVLDIFGFEIFDCNRFEQFCINYANEKLQQHFNQQIFTMEQEEYRAEAIDVEHVDFVDNQDVLDLIEKKPTGVLHMADEELRIPKGSDPNLLRRLHQRHARNSHYIKPMMGKPIFGIEHYAGVVEYSVTGFVEKNRDALDDTLLVAICNSDEPFVGSLLSEGEAKEEEKKPSKPRKNTSRIANLAQSLGGQFRTQLQTLMLTLNQTDPHFVRCIKPNAEKCKENFDSGLVVRQLRYLGLQEVVRIRQLGYSVRYSHELFVRRFELLHHDLKAPKKANKHCVALLEALEAPKNDWRVGKTKVFLKHRLNQHFEKQRELRLEAIIVRLQALVRARLWRRRYLRIRSVKCALEDALKAAAIEPLENALDQYEQLEFDFADELVAQARATLKTLIEHREAVNALRAAIAARDTELLQTAINGARRVALPADHPTLVEATTLCKNLQQYIEDLTKAVKAQDLALLEATLQRGRRLKAPQDSVLVGRAEVLLARLQREQAARERMQKAMAARDIQELREALAQCRQVGLDELLLETAQKLMTELIAQHKAAKNLRAALDSKDIGSATLQDLLNEACSAGVSDSALLKSAEKRVVELRRREKEREEAQRKADLLASVQSVLESALAQDNAKVLVAACTRTDTVLAQIPSKEAGRKAVEALKAKAVAALQRIEAHRVAEKTLVESLDTRTVKTLQSAIAAAKKVGLRGRALVEAEAAVKEIGNTVTALIAAVKKRDLDALTAALALADTHLKKGGKEWKAAQQARKVREQLASETEARKALEHVLEQRSADMLQIAIKRARKAGLRKNDPTLLRAEALAAQIAKEDMLRQQELQAAQRRATLLQTRKRTVAEAKKKGTRPPTVRASIVMQRKEVEETQREARASIAREAIKAGGESKSEGKEAEDYLALIHSGFSFTSDPQFEFYRFPRLRSPTEFTKGRMFGKKALKEGMLSHTTDVLPTSLTQVEVLVEDAGPEALQRMYDRFGALDSARLQREAVKNAVQMFKSVQGFTGDRHYSFPDQLACEVLELCLGLHCLRDELFCQLLKQLTNNPTEQSRLRCWQLLALAMETFPPSRDFLYFLLHFLQSVYESASEFKNYARFCITCLSKTLVKEASEAPTVEHVEAFKERLMQDAEVFVFLLDHSAVRVELSPSTIARQVMSQVVNAIGLKPQNASGFVLYEVVNGVASYIHPSRNVLELKAARTSVAPPPRQPDQKGPLLLDATAARLIFRKRIFTKKVETIEKACKGDPVFALLLYHQAVMELLRGNSCPVVDELMQLCALHTTLMKSGRLPLVSPEFADKALKPLQLKSLQPPSSLVAAGTLSKKKFMSGVEKAAKKMDPKMASPVTLVLRCMLVPLYGAQFFTATQTMAPFLPKTVALAVNLGGLTVVDWHKRESICRFPMQSVQGYKGSPARFVCRVTLHLIHWYSRKHQKKARPHGLVTLYMDMKHGQALEALLKDYIAFLVAQMKGKPPPPPMS